MRRFLPGSLVGRTVLVLLTGLILSQLAGVIIYSFNRIELATRFSRLQATERIVAAVHLVETSAEIDRNRVLRVMDTEGIRIGWGTEPLVQDDEQFGEAEKVVRDLQSHLPGHEIHASAMPPPGPPPSPGGEFAGPGPGTGMRHAGGHGHEGPFLRISVRLTDQSWLNFVTHVEHHGDPLWRPGFVAPLASGLLVVMLLSILAVRHAAKPLGVLAAAAQRLGRDVNAPPVPVNGPREVRAAAEAFNEMQMRLRRFIEDRTQMLAAISHDLRTPITRLKLRAEFIDDDEQRDKLLGDLNEMEAMIAEILVFARDDSAREPRRQVDLAAMLAELAGDMSATYAGPESLMIHAGPIGIKRAFANLIDNAHKYATSCTIDITSNAHLISVIIDDDGPGIPETEFERVFTPFYRIESSRNRESGGTGLGLAVARSAIRAHGGDITLANRATPDQPNRTGLRVIVTLPV